MHNPRRITFIVVFAASALAGCDRQSTGAGETAKPVASNVSSENSDDVVNADTVVVYKTPTCGCCEKWVQHLRDSGFVVTTHDHTDLNPLKQHLGVPRELAACHTATIGGYVIEGHVPADDIRRLLTERPQAKGLAVPGMPIGSPGMEQGDELEAYEVLLFGAARESKVFAAYGMPASNVSPQHRQ